MKDLKTILIATIVFLLLDGIWLGFVAKQLYIDSIGHLLRLENGSIKPDWLGALVVYIALIAGLVIFVLPKSTSIPFALLWGALFGFVTYATYDFTNLAVLSNWPLKISIIDVLWGMTICAVTSGVCYALTR
ncbi:MAG: DUF2177 family protein [Legionellales bacterium]|nr:DUF2177 family protein [Legionellales bacterium]